MRTFPRIIIPATLATGLAGTVGALALGLDRPSSSTNASAQAPSSAAPMPLFDARHRLDWRGTYAGAGDGDDALEVSLLSGQRYSLRSGQGEVREGHFTWFSDGRRILLDDAGGDRVFAIGDGTLHPLPDDRAATLHDLPEDGALRRATGHAAPR